MKKAPVWFCSFLASNHREKRRFRDGLVLMKGAWAAVSLVREMQMPIEGIRVAIRKSLAR